MTSIELMSRLRSHNVRVWAENGQLRYSAPKGVMTDDLLAKIREHKHGLLELLENTGRFRRAVTLRPVERTNTLPLSFAQERLWFLEHLFPASGAYNSGLMMRLAGNLDVPALKKSLQALIGRHESLRTCFPTIGDKPVQVVLDDCPVSIAEHDLRARPEKEREAAADKLVEGEILRPFDLEHGAVTRATLLRMADQEHILLIMIHHIATDGWSRGIIQRELTALYNAQVLQQAPSLPSLPVQYADFAHWQRQWLSGEVLEHQLAYWRTQLADLPTLDLPTDRRRPQLQSQSGADFTFWLSKSLTQDLEALSRQAEVTLATTLLAAFQVLLARYTGQTDIAVGSPIANRPRLDLENLVGLFVNSLVMRTDLSGDPTFREVLARVNEVVLGAYEHQDVPFEQLVAELQPDRDFSRNPLFQVMFAFQNAPREVPAFQGLTIRPVGHEITTTRMDLECFVWEKKEGLHVNLVFNTGLFDKTTIERLGTYFRKVLAEVVSDPARRLSQISLLNEAKRKQLLSEWNDTETTYPREDRIHDLFEAQVERTPDTTALVFGEETLTYRELDTRANHIAHYLKHQHGVGAEVCVGLCMERSPEMVAGILGILKAGGAYVPLDPAYPPARLAYILEDARTRLLLTQERLVQGLPQSKADVVCVDTVPDCTRSAMATTAQSQATSKNLAYLIYTSGSTGQPKGVAIEHRSTVALLHWANGVFGPHELRGVLASTSVCFDLSVFEMFVPLSWGGTVILAENILGLPELARAEEVTLVNTVPSGLTALLRGNPLPASVRTVNLAGEPLRPQLVREIHSAGNVDKIYDLYGPSEDTTYSTKALREWDDPEVIGRPIANTQVYLLDQYLQPVPIGATGELYLGGEGLARGYFDRPALTSEQFIPDPFARKPGARLYRTGDLARYLTDGRIQYLGRADHQVKIRGYRIELGEIEVTLSQHPSVRQAVVVVREDEPGEKRVVAYVALVEETLSPNELRRHLKQTLPDYMVPAHLVMLDALPVTPNGKVDRRALPAPEGMRPELEAAYQAPRGPVEETLARIWTETLRTDQVGRDDNFFDLGGHSLLATQVVARVRDRLGVELPLRALFEGPTVAELARPVVALRDAERELVAPSLVPIPRDGPLALSFAQQRLWFLDQLEPDQSTFNVAWAVRLTGGLAVGALEQALSRIVDRHEVLRTTFATDEDGEPVQIIAPAGLVELEHVELASVAPAERDAELQRQVGERANRPFDLATGPLLRATLYRLSPEEHVLALTIHHIAFDGWSSGVLAGELGALYAALVEGREPILPALQIQYADYAAWQRQWLQGEVLEAQLEYWRRQLGPELPVLELPTDHPRPTQQSFAGACESYALSEPLVASLRSLSQREGVTLFMTLATGLKVLFHRYSGQSVITIGMPVANRARSALEPLIGFFVNSLVLSTELSGELNFREALKRVREVSLGAYAHQDLPFEQLVEAVAPPRDPSRHPLFQVMFALQNVPSEGMELPGLRLSALPAGRSSSQFDLTLFAREGVGGLSLTTAYNTDLFERETIRRLLGHYETLLAGAVADPEQAISRLPLLSEGERQQLLMDWNRTSTPYPHDACIHELLDDQARKTPTAVALVAGNQVLTYDELNTRANQLARCLQTQHGVGPEVCVGVCTDRSADMVVGILGVLKAGGAYVPLDPNYPPMRLAYILEDAQVGVLVTQQRLVADLPQSQASVVRVDADPACLPSGMVTTPDSQASSRDLAYLIYTSGSTGKPKGVAIEHRSAVALLHWAKGLFGTEELQGVLASTSMCFDLSVFEIFVPLSRGGTVILAESILGLPDLPNAEDVTLINTVPSGIAALLRKSGLPDSVRTVNLAGEPLRPQLVRQIEQAGKVERVYDLYGPSEDTTYSTGTLRTGDGPEVIGRPIANTQAYVLDRHLQPVPIGVPGDLYLGGEGLSRGYYNQRALTAEKFIPSPFSEEPGARLYKTGDIARYLADGTIRFLGRADHQVKIRGYRIELGEIETVLGQLPVIKEVVVVVRELSPEDKRVVAYVVPSEGELSSHHLRQRLKQLLPEYMVPAHFVMLDALPLTPNGKVDRKALPDPDDRWSDRIEDYVPPRNPVEEIVTEIWENLLQVQGVGVHDNFFDLGGHSLLAAKIVTRLRASLAVDIPLRAFFDSPTVAGVSDAIAVARRGGEPTEEVGITPFSRDAALPLSYSQERFWVLDQIHTEHNVFNLPSAFRMRGPVQVEIFRQSVQAVLDRHEVFRTTFPSVDGEPRQIIADNLSIEVPLQNCDGLSQEEQAESIQEAFREETCFRFDLARGPLFRARLLRFADDDHCLVLNFHHIVHDAWSLEVIIKDLVAAYTAGCTDHTPVLPALAVQYVDYAQWQRRLVEGPSGKEQLDYWKNQLAQLPPALPLPTDYARPAAQTFRGARENLRLPDDLNVSLRSLNRQEGTTQFMVLLAALQFLLHRLAGAHDILVGSPIAGRHREELQGLTGCFLNTLVLRSDLSGDLTARGLLRRVREVVLNAYENQDVPFERILAEVDPVRDPSRMPIFQVLLNMHSFDDQSLPLPGLSVTRVPVGDDTSLFDMTLYFAESCDEIRASLVYNADLFAPGRMKELMQQLRCILEQMVKEPDRPLEEFSLVTPSARSYLPDPSAPLAAPRQPLVTELINRWAIDTPDRPAVRQGAQQWTYRDLAARAEAIGRSLLATGLKKGMVVALSGAPSFGLIAGMLAVLQRGGVLLMVDLALPDARKCLMLEEAAAGILMLLGDDAAEASWAPETLLRVTVSPQTGHIESASTSVASVNQPEPGRTVGDSAYIFFTSGTTGKPKGIVGSHQSLSHFLIWQLDTFAIKPDDRAAQLTGLSFDVVLRDIFLPLVSGGVLCLPEEADRVDGERLLQWLDRERITVLHTVPAVATSWLATVPKGISLSNLRWVFFAGEPLTNRLVRAWRTAFSGSGKLVNLYGPTETTLAKCFYRVPEEPLHGVQSIGGPLPNTQVLIMNRSHRLCGIGELGEIVVRTSFRTLGPLSTREATGAFFQENPYRPGTQEDLYFTGDLGRYRPDGMVEILGRIDDQVKIRGVRIEPNEVMNALATHPSVHACFVMAREDSAGLPALVTYVVPTAETSPTASELRAYVARQLPPAMVPSSFVFVEAFPYTPNGKIDRQALPDPDAAGSQHKAEFVAPRTPVETLIATIWQEVLGHKQVGINDNFFDLGGHSLLATQVVARVRDSLHIDLKLRHLFEVPVLKGLAGVVEMLKNSTQDFRSSSSNTGEDRSEIVL